MDKKPYKKSAEYRKRRRESLRRWRAKRRAMAEANGEVYRQCSLGKLREQNRVWRSRHPRWQEDYYKRHGEKVDARRAVYYAIRTGRLAKQPCEICGEKRVEAHHDDYEAQLEVRWLCLQHHKKEHLEYRTC